MKINPETWRIIEGIMLIVWVITLIIFLSQIWTNGAKCMNNPLIYGAKVMTEKNNVSFTCKCSFDNEPNTIIFVDKTHSEIILNSKQQIELKGG